MADETSPEIYLLHVWILQISPMIWRRLLVRSDSTLAALHHTIQIAFGWTDSHLHRFRIHGRNYGISRVGGLSFSQDGLPVADGQKPTLSRSTARVEIGIADVRTHLESVIVRRVHGACRRTTEAIRVERDRGTDTCSCNPRAEKNASVELNTSSPTRLRCLTGSRVSDRLRILFASRCERIHWNPETLRSGSPSRGQSSTSRSNP